MKPIRTPHTTSIFKLPGGTDENNLPVEIQVDEEGRDVFVSEWLPTDEERELIAKGRPIALMVWGGQPPVALAVSEP